MAACTPQGAKLLYGWKKFDKFSTGTAALLPQAYLKFYKEWRSPPTPVHYIPKEGSWERNPVTGLVSPVQNIPIPVIYPPEQHQGIWGGEGVVKGFQKRDPYKKRVPHYWVPVLRRTVLHSVVLNKYLSTIVTERTMDLIHESHGFDHYLLKTPACDLKSRLAFRVKREILQALQNNCPDVDPQKKTVILEQYTPEEIEWYGYTFEEAIRKMNIQLSFGFGLNFYNRGKITSFIKLQHLENRSVVLKFEACYSFNERISNIPLVYPLMHISL